MNILRKQLLKGALFLATIIALSSCGPTSSLNRNSNLQERMARVELGMTKSEVMDLIMYPPTYTSRELTREGTVETYTYKADIWVDHGSDVRPVLHRLIFENGRLVIAETVGDYDEWHLRERRRWESRQEERIKEEQARRQEAEKKKEESK